MVEVKTDALEESFEAFERDEDGVAELKAELDLLKAKIASGAIGGRKSPAAARNRSTPFPFPLTGKAGAGGFPPRRWARCAPAKIAGCQLRLKIPHFSGRKFPSPREVVVDSTTQPVQD